MSLYELLSTVVAMGQIENKTSAKPEVTDEEWEQSMSLIEDLAKFDNSLQL